MEDDRWIVTIGGWLGDRCADRPSRLSRVRAVALAADIYELVKDAEPLTDAVTYAFPSNLRHRTNGFALPGRYLVMGDALCSFNPFYGQGMSVCALEGLALAESLDRRPSLDALWRPFFRRVSRIIDTPWMIAAGSDFAFPGVSGRKPAGTDFVNWYLERVHRAASTDHDGLPCVLQCGQPAEPASTLFHPRVVTRVAKACLWAEEHRDQAGGRHRAGVSRPRRAATGNRPPVTAHGAGDRRARSVSA